MPQFEETHDSSRQYPTGSAASGGQPQELTFCEAIYSGTSPLARSSLPGTGIVVEVGPARPPKFPLGRLVITPAAAKVIPADEALSAVARHAAGDWGNVSQPDWLTNDDALRHGDRLFSVYRTIANETFWIITEADRQVTTILLPSDY